MKIEHLRANHFEQFLGMRSDPLELSWTVTEATGQKTARSRVRVAADADLQTVLFDSGWGDWDSLGYTPALELAPRTRYYWQVCCVSDDGEEGQSDTAWFETGKRDEDWQAAWITSPYEDDAHYYVARDFDAADVVSARAYVAAHGGYELYLNGEKVGDEYLAPGYYCYDDKDMVYTYDLGPYLRAHNRIGAMLAPSWFKGRFGLGFFRTRAYSNLYGKRMEFLCEIRLRMADGTERVIGTDAAWQCLPSPVTMSGIYDGEDYDARLETPGWCESGSANGTWSAAVPAAGTGVRLVDRSNPPIRVTETLKGTVITTPAGETILDFGQNLTGWYELDVDVPAGTEVVVRCCEVLEHGNWYRETLRSARAELHYISAGRPAHVRPHSTFFGFRYLKLEGAPLDPENLVAYVIHSDLPRTGWVETDNELVNRLISNAYWGQRDNVLDVPTDCPQRDERMGWTGDTQVFSDTACFNQYTPAFYAKWLEDLSFEQTLMNGGVPGTVPATKPSTGGQNMQMNSCGWGDAATVVPWNVYQHYGDKVQLARNYPSMRAYVDYLFRLDEADGGKRLWQTGHHTADWLALDNYKYPEAPQGGTDEHYIASAYYAHSARIVARAASELGNTADAEKYEQLSQEIRAAMVREYFTPNGRCTSDTQTAYLIALKFDIVPETMRPRLCSLLQAKLYEDRYHLQTGFLGTPLLCPTLSENHMNELAYCLLLNEEYPGWLNEVKLGATTLWERWNSVMPDGTVNRNGMSSMNHYAYGAIVEWIYRYACGLRSATPGWRRAVLAPLPNVQLRRAKARYESASGTWACGWEIADDHVDYTVQVPFGCTAELRLPGEAAQKLTPGSYHFRTALTEEITRLPKPLPAPRMGFLP